MPIIQKNKDILITPADLLKVEMLQMMGVVPITMPLIQVVIANHTEFKWSGGKVVKRG